MKFVEPFGGLKAGDTFHFNVPGGGQRFWGSLLEVKGGKIIAVDQEGCPALVTNTLGTGKTLLSAYPIETYLAGVPAAFEKQEDTHRIYEAFREWTGVKQAWHSDQPSVEVTSLQGDHRGYAFVVNHSARPYEVTITSATPLKSARQLTTENPKDLTVDGSNWIYNPRGNRVIAAVDIGGTKIAVGMVAKDGRVLSRVECPTDPERGYKEALARIEQMLRVTSNAAGDKITGIGIGSTGPRTMLTQQHSANTAGERDRTRSG